MDGPDVEIVTGLAYAAAGELGLRGDAARAAQDTQRLNALTEQTAAQSRDLQDSLPPPHLPSVPGMQKRRAGRRPTVRGIVRDEETP